MRSLLPIGILFFAIGCRPPTTVSGKVTFDGAAVDDGFITFFPEGGDGATVASPIHQGKYRIANAKPGVHLVEIVASKKISFAMSTAEMEAKFKEAQSKGNRTGIIAPADLIPPNALGNRRKVTLNPGEQTFDFDLKRP